MGGGKKNIICNTQKLRLQRVINQPKDVTTPIDRFTIDDRLIGVPTPLDRRQLRSSILPSSDRPHSSTIDRSIGGGSTLGLFSSHQLAFS